MNILKEDTHMDADLGGAYISARIVKLKFSGQELAHILAINKEDIPEELVEVVEVILGPACQYNTL